MKSYKLLLGLVSLCSLAITTPIIDCQEYYEVSEGETCENIINNVDVSFEDILKWNTNIDCENLKIGDKVCINVGTFVTPYKRDTGIIGGLGNIKIKKTCDSKSKVKISKSKTAYKYGYYKYKIEKGSALTAAHYVNGCTGEYLIKLGTKLGVVKNSNSLSLFTPACNSHDVCYGCLKKKSDCDNNFHSNMKTLCSKAYSDKKSTKYKNCINDAKTFYTAVKNIGFYGIQKSESHAYNRDTSSKCGYCGADVIKTFIKTPYYLTK